MSGPSAYRSLQLFVVWLFLAAISRMASVGRPSFIQFALAGSFLALIATRQPWLTFIKTAAAAAVFAAIYFGSGGVASTLAGGWCAVPAAFLGLGAIATVCQETFWSGERRLNAAERDVLWITILTPSLCLVSATAISAASELMPLTRDPFLYWFDQGLGFQPSFEVGRWFVRSPHFAQLCGAVYNMLPIWMTTVFLLQGLRPRPELDDVRVTAIWLGVAGFLLYFICPAAGPIHYLREGFPWTEARLEAAAVVLSPAERVPRNAMPSLHAGWALMLFYQSWRWGRMWTASFTAILVLTLFATLGSGEHYLIDLAAAAPLVLAIQAARAGRPHRYAAAFGVILAIAWPLSLRSDLWLSQPLAAGWTLAAFTAAVSIAWSLRIALDSRELVPVERALEQVSALTRYSRT